MFICFVTYLFITIKWPLSSRQKILKQVTTLTVSLVYRKCRVHFAETRPQLDYCRQHPTKKLGQYGQRSKGCYRFQKCTVVKAVHASPVNLATAHLRKALVNMSGVKQGLLSSSEYTNLQPAHFRPHFAWHQGMTWSFSSNHVDNVTTFHADLEFIGMFPHRDGFINLPGPPDDLRLSCVSGNVLGSNSNHGI